MPETEVVAWLKKEFPSSRRANRLYKIGGLFNFKSGEEFSQIVVTYACSFEQGEMWQTSRLYFLNGEECIRENLCNYNIKIRLDANHRILSITEFSQMNSFKNSEDYYAEPALTEIEDYQNAVIRVEAIIKLTKTAEKSPISSNHPIFCAGFEPPEKDGGAKR